MREVKKSFCRFCHVFCGLDVEIEDNRVIAVRGDRDNPVSEGYTCPKGRAERERINHPDRVLRPRKRVPGGWQDLPPEQALDEIALRLREIVDQYGPDAVAVYVGCGGHRTANGGPWFVRRWLQALGSRSLYTTYTIDSPSLTVATHRLFGGPAPAYLLDIERADCAMFVGTNPAGSHQINMPQSNPSARINDARKRGMKLIVIDPRCSDVARWADIHLQVKPGEDATLLAGMVKVVLDRGLQDREYVAAYVSGVEQLHEAVHDFDLDYVQARAGVPAKLVEEAAVTFASAASGGSQTGTGLHMAPHHNLTTGLSMTLNALCGRYDRPGGLNRTEGPLGRAFGPCDGPIPLPADIPRSRVRNIQALPGLFGKYLEMPTNTLADEILTPGNGQIRALIVNGGNPALVFVDEQTTQRALESLDLLVVNDLFMSPTAIHADYVLAMKHPFERPDLPKLMDGSFPFTYSQYTPALCDGPPDCLEEWEVFWKLAGRMDLPLRVGGLDAREMMPSSDELLRAQFSRSRIPFQELIDNPSGVVRGERHTSAGGIVPNMIAHPDRRLAAGHPEVLEELRAVRNESIPVDGRYQSSGAFAFRLITYRMKEVYCSQGHNLPSLRRKRSFNPVLMHPQAMREAGVEEGDTVVLESRHGRVKGIVEASDSVRQDVIACAFGWGDPAEPDAVQEKGSNIQRLLRADCDYDPVTGLALQSAIPVNVHLL